MRMCRSLFRSGSINGKIKFRKYDENSYVVQNIEHRQKKEETVRWVPNEVPFSFNEEAELIAAVNH